MARISKLTNRHALIRQVALTAFLASGLISYSPFNRLSADEPAPAKAADSPPACVEFLPPLSVIEQQITAALAQPTHFIFTETPLQDAVDFLQDQHQLQIQLDIKALEEAGIGGDTPVTRKLDGIPLRSALKLLLDPLQLTFDIRNDVLNITTKEAAGSWLITRTYPVGDLSVSDDFADVAKAITSVVHRCEWNTVGGLGELVVVRASKSLVISQTRDAHDEILELLRSLRAARKIAEGAGPKP